jgi:hypothetical protein
MQPGAGQGQADEVAPPAGNTSRGPVPSSSSALPQTGVDMPDLPLAPQAPGDHVVGARDFSYDRSELPRYPNADKVVSAMTVPAGGAVSDSNSTVATILSHDDPDTVIAWYRTHLPSGWTEQAPPSADAVDQVAKQASTAAPGGTPLDAMLKTIAGSQLQQALPGLARVRAAHLTMFWPPDRTTDTRGVLITLDQKTGETAVLLSRKATRS